MMQEIGTEDDLIAKKARELAEWLTGGVTPDGLADGAVDTWTRELDKQLRAMVTGLPIEHIAEDAAETEREKGWMEGVTCHDGENPHNSGEVIALMHSELSECLEDLRCPVAYWNNDGIAFEPREPNASRTEEIPPHRDHAEYKPVGPATEMADAIIRIAGFCKYRGWDLAKALRLKLRYNKTRPHRHGGRQF